MIEFYFMVLISEKNTSEFDYNNTKLRCKLHVAYVSNRISCRIFYIGLKKIRTN